MIVPEELWIGFVVAWAMVFGGLVVRWHYLRVMRQLVAREVARYREALEAECERTADWNFRAGRERGANEMAVKACCAGLRVN